MKKLLSLFTALPLVAILMFGSLVFAGTGDLVVEGKNVEVSPKGIAYGASYFPDYNEVDQGIIGGGRSTKDYIDAISTDGATLVFQHNSGAATTTYTFSTSEIIPSNINIVIEKGAILFIAAAQTLTLNGSFDAGLYQVFSGDGSVDGLSEAYPEWFGALGDGVTDDANTTQKAINASNVLKLSSKTYIIGTQLNKTSSDFTLLGEGQNSILKLKASTNSNIIYIRGTAGSYIDDVQVSNVHFDGNMDNQVASNGTGNMIALFVRYANTVKIEDCYFTNNGCSSYPTGHAIGKGIQLLNTTNSRIQNNYFYHNRLAISIAEASNLSVTVPDDLPKDVLITNNYIDGGVTNLFTENPIPEGISCQATRVTVTGNIVKNIAYPYIGLHLAPYWSEEIGKFVVSGNTFFNIGGVAINADVSDANESAKYMVISNNYFEDIGQKAISSMSHCTITSNVLKNIGMAGVAGDSIGIQLGGNGYAIVTDNLIYSSLGTSLTKWGIFVWLNDTNESIDNLIIKNNIIHNTLSESIKIAIISPYLLTDSIISENICDNAISSTPYVASPTEYGFKDSQVLYNIASAQTVGTNGVGGMTIKNQTVETEVSNGGFDSNTTGWDGATATLASIAGGQSGNCLELTRTAGTTQFGYQAITGLVAGKTYQLSAYVKSGTSGDESFQIGMSHPNPGDNAYGTVNGTSSGAWVKYTVVFQHIVTTDSIKLHLKKNTVTAGTMLFDSVELHDVNR